MVKLMSNSEDDKLKLKNDEVDELKNLKKKIRKGIQKRKLIDAPCESNMY